MNVNLLGLFIKGICNLGGRGFLSNVDRGEELCGCPQASTSFIPVCFADALYAWCLSIAHLTIMTLTWPAWSLCPSSEDFYGSDTSFCNHWPFALEPTPSFYSIYFINWWAKCLFSLSQNCSLPQWRNYRVVGARGQGILTTPPKNYFNRSENWWPFLSRQSLHITIWRPFPQLLTKLPLKPNFALHLWTIWPPKYIKIYTGKLILRHPFHLRPGAASLPAPPR